MRSLFIWKIMPVFLALALGTGCSRETAQAPDPAPLREAELPDRIDLYYFYEELCQSCITIGRTPLPPVLLPPPGDNRTQVGPISGLVKF
ncbi:MAG: hypothetical protein LBB78_10110 [Spirochaetaceae bacterium]|jgi:hypothetical protein|nr:hypothetical protein [Spirochaetaceae bacterium]